MPPYSDAELAALMLLRHAFSWKVSLDRRSGVWVATYGGERIRRDTPLGLFDALSLAAWARRTSYLPDSDREPGDSLTCDGYQERLEQLAAIIHEATAQILVELEAVRTDLADLSRAKLMGT